MTSNTNEQIAENFVTADDQTLDLSELYFSLKRNWKIVISGGVLGIFASSIYLALTKPIYQGEFQIVLDKQGSQTGAAALLAQNPGLAALAGVGAGNNNDVIATEVQILNSPSVLMPIFEEVKSRKPPYESKNMRFERWIKTAITAEEIKGTSVLDVKFRDTDKDIVLPITKLLSSAYQKYSQRGRSRELNNLVEYLNDQINIMKPQSEKSSIEALNYGFQHGLGVLDGLPLAGTVAGAGVSEEGAAKGSAVTLAGGSVESARTAGQQKVKALEIQIEEAKRAGAGSLYFASQLASLTDKSSTFDQLTLIESRLAEYRSRLKDNDPLVLKLQRERKSLIKYINLQTIALLNGELDLAKANLQALDRPKEVISMHRELTQKALRDEATLVTLQNQLKQFELEQARNPSPWELISKPIVLERPISPRKGNTIFMGFLIGLIGGSSLSFLKDKRSGIIFSFGELSSKMPGNFIGHIEYDDDQDQKDQHSFIKLIVEGLLADAESVGLIKVGDLDKVVFDTFSSNLRQMLPQNVELIVSSNLMVTRKCSTQLFITSLGAVNRKSIEKLGEQLKLQGGSTAGWVLASKRS